MSESPGFIIAESSPFMIEAINIVRLTSGLLGSPNETLLNPNTVQTPKFSLTSLTALRVSLTKFC